MRWPRDGGWAFDDLDGNRLMLYTNIQHKGGVNMNITNKIGQQALHNFPLCSIPGSYGQHSVEVALLCRVRDMGTSQSALFACPVANKRKTSLFTITSQSMHLRPRDGFGRSTPTIDMKILCPHSWSADREAELFELEGSKARKPSKLRHMWLVSY